MMLIKIREAAFRPKGFKDENALLEGIARSCAVRRTIMITGNYTVKEGPDTPLGDPRLLGTEMLLTIELAARAYGRCVKLGIEPPTLVLLPNDIAPGVFESARERMEFKAAYALPQEVREILSAHGLPLEPEYFFNRDSEGAGNGISSWSRQIRKRLRETNGGLVVLFESFAQNLASKALKRGSAGHGEEMVSDGDGGKKIFTPTDIRDTFSGEIMLMNTLVSITHSNGAPFCSFLAATLFREFENLGFESMVNTFVMQEYPCVDKAAAAYKYMYGGKMAIRNIYLEGATVVLDNTIN
ncbi:MAG: hypothetical protein V1861_06340 [Candidatus Micrarchaeota archaeon]